MPPEAELFVVDATDHHLIQHEIHRAIRRPGMADHLEIPLADVLDRATIRQTRVTDVNVEDTSVTLAGGEEFTYDVGAICLGAETDFRDLPGVQAHATPLKSLADAATIRAEFLSALSGGDANVVIGGAGLSGIQVAGELAVLAREQGQREAVEIHLLEQESTVAPAFPRQFQAAVHDALTARDVVVRTNAAVAEAEDGLVRLEDETELPADQFVWTGGIRGPDALAGERPIVRSRLQFDGSTFVLGDAARVIDADGEAVPASAQAAVAEARVAAENLTRLVDYRLGDREEFEPRLAPFRFDAPGWLVSVGDSAVAQVGPAVFTGTAAKALKTTVGAGYISSVGGWGSPLETSRIPPRVAEPWKV